MTMTAPQDTVTIRLTVNAAEQQVTVPARKLLVDMLRDDLALTGTHLGCEQGVCGACTVILDGAPVRSCLMFASQAEGAAITTIEGVADGVDDLDAVQQAFWEHHGLQCGYCTPGMVLTAKAFLEEVPDPTDEEIREAIAGNICRCTGYVFIVDSIRAAAATLRGDRAEESAT
jgi:carbon-monoxide dehydrogenase small subunit